MNKLLKGTIIGVLVLAAVVVLAIWQPWTYITNIPGISAGTALTINTQSGKAEVYLDEKKVGETPFSSENLTPGDHSLRLVRISQQEDFYEPIQKQIHIEADTRTFLEAEIGPERQFSSLKLVYYRKDDPNSSGVYIDSSPEDATVYIDDEVLGEAPLTSTNLEIGRHTLKVTKDGYEPEETVIIVRDGYTLIAEFQLMAKPIELSAQ